MKPHRRVKTSLSPRFWGREKREADRDVPGQASGKEKIEPWPISINRMEGEGGLPVSAVWKEKEESAYFFLEGGRRVAVSLSLGRRSSRTFLLFLLLFEEGGGGKKRKGMAIAT